MWWLAKLDFEFPEESHLVIPFDEELFVDLCTPTWSKNKRGRIQIQSKEEITKLIGRSTNKGDAFVYWNFVRARRVTAGATALVDATVVAPKLTTPERHAASKASPFAAKRRRTW